MTEVERINKFNKAKVFFEKKDFFNAKIKFKELLKENLNEYGPNYFLAKIAQEEKDLNNLIESKHQITNQITHEHHNLEKIKSKNSN